MEESFSWKIIYVAAIFSLIVLGIAYFLISPRESPFFKQEKTEKIAEFSNTRIEGRKEGKTVWEFFARSGWTEKSQEITYLNNVSRGKIYNQAGRPVLTDLSAPRAQTYRHSEIVEAFGPIHAYLDLGKFSSRPGGKNEWIRLAGSHIKYIPSEKRSELDGDLVLSKKDSSIRSEKLGIDHERKVAVFPAKVRIVRKDGTITADSLEYLGEPEQLNAAGNVHMDMKSGGIRTRVICGRSTSFLNIDQDVSLWGSLEAAQGKKSSVAREGTYSRKQNGLFLRGGTRTILEPGEKKKLKEKTVVLANEIYFSTKTGDARASGSVEAAQKGREAKAETAVYDDNKELLTLSGNVFMKKGEDWISCRQIVISVKKGTFEALGVKEARFRL